MKSLKFFKYFTFSFLVLGLLSACTVQSEIKNSSCGPEKSKTELSQNRQQVIYKIRDAYFSKDYETLLSYYVSDIRGKVKGYLDEVLEMEESKLKKFEPYGNYVFHKEALRDGNVWRLHYRVKNNNHARYSAYMKCEQGMYRIIKEEYGTVL